MVIKCDWLCKLLGIRGIMLFPFCIVRGLSKWYTKEKQQETIDHEKIHFKQCLELGIIGFYILYLFYQIKHGYRNNPFEVEAFKYQCCINKRKPYGWVKIKK